MKTHCYFQDTAAFTVGEIRLLTCKGDIPALLPPLKTQFQDESKKYALHVLETVSIQEREITLKVTGYQTGNYNSPVFWLTDGQHSIRVEGLSWKIPSVLTSETGFYPAYGPWKIKVPLWYEVSWIFLAISFLVFGFFVFKKHRRKVLIRKKIIDRLEGKSPVQYFIRQLSSLFVLKKNSKTFLIQLKNSFREFLENQFEIPLETPSHKILKYKSIDKKAGQILSELETALNNQSSYSNQDGEQLLSMVRNWIFQFEKKHSINQSKKEVN